MFINDLDRVRILDDAVSGGELILGHEFYQNNLALTHTEFENKLNGRNLLNINKGNLNVEFLKSVLEDFEDYFLSVEYLLGRLSEEFKLNFLKNKYQNIITLFNTLFGKNFEITAYQVLPEIIVELKLILLEVNQNMTKDLLTDISNFTPESLDYSKIKRVKICLQTENSIKSDLHEVARGLKQIKASFDSNLLLFQLIWNR